MSKFKAYRIKSSREIVAGETIRTRKGNPYTFQHIAENGNVVTQEGIDAEFSHHPNVFVDLMVRQIRAFESDPAYQKQMRPLVEAAKARLEADIDPVKAVFGDFHSIDSKYIKSYATKQRLAAALVKMGATKANGINALAVCNSAGRWTAIIGIGGLNGNLTAFDGFMKFG